MRHGLITRVFCSFFLGGGAIYVRPDLVTVYRRSELAGWRDGYRCVTARAIEEHLQTGIFIP